MHPMLVTPPFRFSATLEAHESDVKAVVAPYSDLVLTASRDETVCAWSRAGTAEREFRLSAVGLGHGAYVNSLAFVFPDENHANGLIASGNLAGLILIHEAPSRGSWASSVDGEAGATPGREDGPRPSEQPIRTLVGHAHNVCSLSTSTPSWAVTPLSVACSPAATLPSTSHAVPFASTLPGRPRAHACSSGGRGSASVPSSGTSSPVGGSAGSSGGQQRRPNRPLSLSIPSPPSFGPPSASKPEEPLSAVTPTMTNFASAGGDGGRPYGTASPTRRAASAGRRGYRPGSSGSTHSSPVPAAAPRFPPPGAVEKEPLLISTSWDCTARVWSMASWECILVLEGGHHEAVWAGIVVEPEQCGRSDGRRTFLTASADRTIIHWDDEGNVIRKFKDSTDVVRSLVLLPNNEFASASNDGTIRVWSFDGELRAVLVGHKSFVYSVCILPNGDLASAGEDHCVRIWSNGKQIQTILHPAISVWSVAALPNGDIVTGASDFTARIFTRDPGRVADQEVIAAYEEAVAENAKSPPVVDGTEAGPSYFKLSVDVADDRPPLELNYNTKEPPSAAAARFVGQHELPETYVDQITAFLRSHVPFASPAPTPASELTGFAGISTFAPPIASVPATLPSLEATLAEQLARDNANASAQSSEDGRQGAFESDEERTLEGVARLIRSGAAKRIVILAGAGTSTNAGIPDFRSPETGLYANLERYNLPHPEAVFDIDYFRSNPKPFYELAKELYPGKFLPTLTHYLYFLLQKHGLLQRIFTQNIDTLERVAGVRDSLIVEAHGSFASARCIICHKEAPQAWVKEQVEAGTVPLCPGPSCKGRSTAYVKPDIVFFGESLPDKFFAHLGDLASCDLLLVFGTSLKVHPFASLIDRVAPDVPRVLINQEVVGEAPFKGSRRGFHFDLPIDEGGRDVMYRGDSDSASRILAKGLRLEAELDAIMREKRAELAERWNLVDGESGKARGPPGEPAATASETVEALAAKLATEL